MRITRLGSLAAALCLAAAIGMMGGAQAQTLEDLLGIRAASTSEGAASQGRIDDMADETERLLAQYKRVLKVVESLRVYNEQKRRLIKNQELELVQLDEAIVQATRIQRHIEPLIERMIDSLEDFVNLDLPFLMEERRDRLFFLRETYNRADVSSAEKFNQVFQAYQIETTYGTTIETYKEVIQLDGEPRQVDVLKWGRVALVFQTPDQEVTGVWDKQADDWVILSDSYRRPVRDGLRIANKTQTADLVRLPIPVPTASTGGE